MKKTILWFLIFCVFLIAFNVIFFTVMNRDRNVSTWISYGAIHLAYLMLVLSVSLGNGKRSKAVLNLSLGAVSAVFFIIEFLLGVIFILLAPKNTSITITVQTILFAIHLIIFLSVILSNVHTTEAEERHADETAYVRDNATRIKVLLGQIVDDQQRRVVEQAYATLKSSPAKTNDAVADIEREIVEQIGILETAVNCQKPDQVIAVANTIVTTVNTRNQILQASH